MFTSALEQLGRFRGEGSFAGWLFQIARNTVRDVHRQRRMESLAEERPAGGPTPEEQLLERERAQELRALIRLLAPEHQHLLALRYGADLGYEGSARLSARPLRPCVSGCTGSSKSYDGGIPMTMHDDSRLDLLESDLHRLAEPRDDDERIRFAIRGQLAASAAPRPLRTRPSSITH